MIKLIWLSVFIISVTANDIQGVLPLPEDVKVDTQIEPEKIVDSLPMVELTKSKPTEKSFENSKDLDETILQPIGPIFPSFLQPGGFFGQMPSLRNGIISNNDAEVDSEKPKGGILTIILVKSKHNENPDIIEDAQRMTKMGSEELKNGVGQFKDEAEKNFNSLTQFILNDLFGMKSSSESAPHLLGGSGDPDHFIRFGGENRDLIHFVKGNEMPVVSNDLGRHRELFDYQDEQGRNCNFLRFLRLKAHVHYRTIIHLIFISGVILIVLMMFSLTVKVNKRRNALRRYAKQGMIDVSSINSSNVKQREAETGRTFRLGSVISSREQRMAPPAYDQISNSEQVSSTLVKSLATTYKGRYERMSSDDEDRKSVSSLPAYEEKPEPKK